MTALAQAFPGTQICLSHIGGPLAIGAYQDRREAIFAGWAKSIRILAACPNVVVKLASQELGAAWKPYMATCIEALGADRCMLESNFPVDKGSYGYAVFWNACKIWRRARQRRRRATCSAVRRRASIA